MISRADGDLLKHFSNEGIDFYQMYFKWTACLLLRQFTMKTGLRLLDSFLSNNESGYFGLCTFTLAAIVLKYSKKLKKMKF